ncbi:MAG: phospho-N-acetylmuramoyl-pentapeptide-transferase [Chlamydiales bacterium]|nr:phospho-N-acetylmuramoyl-pentapeptide-transferase [Chlamydiales bacterium]NCF70307.1 phospho-N-acetylmuramoyl-pentapeptide-transferase [Chlamydiales bacterium]
MAIDLLQYLFNSLGAELPVAFSYYSTKMILGLVSSLLICIFCGPSFIKKLYELKIGQSIRKEECPHLAELHAKKQDTPTMGGVLIIISLLLSSILWMDFSYPYTWILLITLLVLGGLGAYDDYLKLKYRNAKGISSRAKFLSQLLLAVFLLSYLLSPIIQESVNQLLGLKALVSKQWVYSSVEPNEEIRELAENSHFMRDLYFPFIKQPIYTFHGLSVIVLAIFMVTVITGSSNAVNLTDGLDGLASGVYIIACIPLAIIAFLSNNIQLASYLNLSYIDGSGEVAIFLCSVIGALLGFLWFNAPPAQIFMGDTGSLGLGGILGISAILIRREFLLAIVGGVFVLETLSVILQVLSYRFRNKKRIFLCAPLHHHFEYKGWAETKVVIRFWIIAILFSMIGLSTIKFQ